MKKDAVRLMNRQLSDAQRLTLADEQLRRWHGRAMMAAHSLEIAIENRPDRAGVMQAVLTLIETISKDTPVTTLTTGRIDQNLFGARR